MTGCFVVSSATTSIKSILLSALQAKHCITAPHPRPRTWSDKYLRGHVEFLFTHLCLPSWVIHRMCTGLGARRKPGACGSFPAPLAFHRASRAKLRQQNTVCAFRPRRISRCCGPMTCQRPGLCTRSSNKNAGGFIATMAATNKCLAQSNKSRTGGKATKKRSNPATRADPMGADHRIVPAIKQALSMLGQARE
jgi:hypothetical protein